MEAFLWATPPYQLDKWNPHNSNTTIFWALPMMIWRFKILNDLYVQQQTISTQLKNTQPCHCRHTYIHTNGTYHLVHRWFGLS